MINGYTDANGNFIRGVPTRNEQTAQKYVEGSFDQGQRVAGQNASNQITQAIYGQNVPQQAQVKDTSNVAQALFDKNYSLMRPAIKQSQSRLLTNLQARGLPVGGKAFNDAYGDQLTRTQEQISRLAQDSTAAAGQEQTRQYGLDTAARSNSLNEIMQAIGGSYTPQSKIPSGSTSNIDYTGLVNNQYNAQSQQYAANKQQTSSTLGTLGSLAGIALLACSRDIKEVICPMNTAEAARVVAKIPLLTWRYQPDAASAGLGGAIHIGPMAQDLHALTGLGQPDVIDPIDMFGVLAGALQDALHRIADLEALLTAAAEDEGDEEDDQDEEVLQAEVMH